MRAARVALSLAFLIPCLRRFEDALSPEPPAR